MFDSGANCFLNALVREFSQWKYSELPESIATSTGCTRGFRCKISPDEYVYLPLIAHSNFGRSYFYADQFMYDFTNEAEKKLNFNEFLKILTRHPEIFSDDKLGVPQVNNLLKVIGRAEESQTNILKVLSYRGNDLTKIFEETLDFIESEQSLLVGHSIHPCPKSRSGFNELDEEIYVPEYANEFQLSWFAVDKQILYVFSGTQKRIETYCHELVETDPALSKLAEGLDDDYLLMPCHPWQAKHWQSNPKLAGYFESHQLINLGQHGKLWRATSSLRSLYQKQTPWMLKFSLSTQLTNSIRHLQPEEMIRGQVIEKVLSTEKAKQIEQDFPKFSIMREPISVALKDTEGKVLDSTAIIWRQNPFYAEADSNCNTEVLSSLLQDLPNKAENRLSLRLKAEAEQTNQDPESVAQAFLRNFLQVVIKPILIAQAKYGLLFGAHQQNIVIQLNDQRMPVKAYFRDCQGTGFSELAKKLYGEELLKDTSDSGNLFENDTVIHLFTYYLFVNSCFNTISSLTLTKLLSEEVALGIYQGFLLQLKAESLADTRVIDYLLEAKDIWSKGNFFCNLHAINENTMSDPFLIYHQLTNPVQAINNATVNAA